MGGAQSRIALLSESLPSRLHNKVSVFERVTEPKIAHLTSEGDRSSSAESAASPRKYPRLPLGSPSYNAEQKFRPMNHEDFFPNAEKEFSPMPGRERSRKTEQYQGESPDDISKPESSNFTSKLQMILDDFKKGERKQGSRASGLQFGKDRRTQAPKPQPTDFWGEDIQDSEVTDVSFNESSGAAASQNRRDSRRESQGETLANQSERPSSSTDSFNLFANSPSVPPRTSQRSTPVSPRRLSRSIGSRSSPSRSSIPGRFSKYSRSPDSNGTSATTAMSWSRPTQETSQSLFKTNVSGTDLAKQQRIDDSHTSAFSVKSSSRVYVRDSNAQTSPASSQSFIAEALSDSDAGDDGSIISTAAKPLHYVERDTANTKQSKQQDFSSALSDSRDATYSWDEGSSGVIKTHVTNQGARSTLPKSSARSNHNMTALDKGNHDSFGASDDTVPVKNHPLSDLPFEFQYSYSEAPKAPILRQREDFSPFGPSTMQRPWTGRAPLKPSKKKLREFDSFNPPPRDKKGIKYVQDPGPFPEGQGPKPAKTREEILGEPLTKDEVALLVEKCNRESRQVNLGRDGLTHNMLDLIHTQWKRRRVCRIKCKGVPTVDMDNVCFHVEDKTGGKIIYRHGGVLYLFRGRNYNYKDRPRIPLMLWKPISPVYPKLIQPAPGGLTKEQAHQLRAIGRKIVPICKLGKNGVYLNLVQHVRNGFKVDDLVRIDCRGLNPSDYKKIGAKLRDLVPCVLLSFEREYLLLWKGKESNASSENDTESGDAAASLIDSIYVEKKQESESSVLEQTVYRMSDSEKELLSGETSDDDISTVHSSSANEDVPLASEDSEESGDDELEFDDELQGEEGEDNALTDVQLQVEEGQDNALTDVELKEKGQVDWFSMRVTALWEQAVESGMAVDLDESDLDADSVHKRAVEIAKTAPPGPNYTRSLLNRLRLRKQKKPVEGTHVHLPRPSRTKPKRPAKRVPRVPTVEVPPMGGLPVDELARLLAR